MTLVISPVLLLSFSLTTDTMEGLMQSKYLVCSKWIIGFVITFRSSG